MVSVALMVRTDERSGLTLVYEAHLPAGRGGVSHAKIFYRENDEC